MEKAQCHTGMGGGAGVKCGDGRGNVKWGDLGAGGKVSLAFKCEMAKDHYKFSLRIQYMSQNSLQQAAAGEAQAESSPEGEKKNQDSRVLSTVDIYISPDNSNQCQDPSLRLPPQLDQDQTFKEIRPQEISSPNPPATAQEDINSENQSEINKKSEPLKTTKKDLPRQTKPVSTKCWNKLCLAKGVKKTKSKVNGRYFWLCPSCSRNYSLGQFCEFCEQIYAQEEVDGLEWIQCESRGCGRWNHTMCEEKYSDFNPQNLYFCTRCRTHYNSKVSCGPKSESVASEKTNKRELEDIYSTRVKVFNDHRDHFGYLESMLTSYSYKLSLPQDQLKQDALFSIKREGQNLSALYPGLDRPLKKRKLR